jgi:hypothetical protein
MTHVIERQPTTFSEMDEAALRDILLVVLNNQFGPAGGEMFSGRGKTDILIQHDRGAVFIAECKIWRGEKGLAEAIDQLLGYLVWRDTKSALVLFVREKGVSAIIEKAHAVIRAHSRFKRAAPNIGASPVFILHHDQDPNREIEVAVVAVPIPST